MSAARDGEAAFAGLAFRYTWRPYQERVLAAVDRHFSDQRLHIVAAPGAGKTTLGLEVVRRLGARCLILSPTRTIRDQWIARLADFLPEDGPRPLDLPWVSRSLGEPGSLTSITYQALHTDYRESLAPEDEEEQGDEPDKREVDATAARIRKAGFRTLVLDEAHHLHSEWWKALKDIADRIDGLHIVCLTATPPYDVVGLEWRRYQDLCGAIDEEISVPELVRAGNLCPHQDYVYLVGLTESNRERVAAYENAVADVLYTLEQRDEFRQAVVNHPWMQTDGFDLVTALDGISLLVALLAFRKHAGVDLPRHCLKALDASPADIPDLSRRWWNTLVAGFLFDSSFTLSDEQQAYQKKLARHLRAEGLLHRRELRLNESKPVQRALATASEKIDACVAIHAIEREKRGRGLRQVILTDYIRDEGGVDGAESGGTLGAWPVFRAIVRATPQGEWPYLALLTGRVIIVHSCHEAVIRERIPEATFTPVEFMGDFVRVSGGLTDITKVVTRLLQTGRLRLLVGTRALLGEGWDCPAANSLVLATFIGAFVMTNQMRGRVIRVDRDAPNKTASVWHLAAIDTRFFSGIVDYVSLADRFRTFVGVHYQDSAIEAGMARLGMPDPDSPLQALSLRLGIDDVNEEMAARLGHDLEGLRGRWQEAIESAEELRLIPAVKTPAPPSFRAVHFSNTLRWLMVQAFTVFMSIAAQTMDFMEGVFEGSDTRASLLVVSAVFGIAFIAALPATVRALIASWRHLPVDGSIRQIGLALRDALCEVDLIQTEPRRLRVVTVERQGEWYVSLVGADYYEQSLFADSLNEILGPIENPRYLITRRAGLRIDYHAVPTVLGTHKEKAEAFYRFWRKRVSKGTLVYTRRPGGREQLLKARARAFSSRFVRKCERLGQWQ